MDISRIQKAYLLARDALMAEQSSDGFWLGELSSSALATAVACIALRTVDSQRHQGMIDSGINWLIQNQNNDGGWGDTTKSFSNISTSMLVRAAFAICDQSGDSVSKLEIYISTHCGTTPAERAESIRNRYGKDRTFSVPILMTCAIAGFIPWKEVPRLPFELACLPQSWYRFARMPVVSYALPALIAIGQCVHHHRPKWNPITTFLRWWARKPSLNVLRRIQPTSGGYLEATPLTAFVVMSLAEVFLSKARNSADKNVTEIPPKAVISVLNEGIRFIVDSMRPDGSWPIDTNLSIWVTTLSVNALAAANDLKSLPNKEKIFDWLLVQQTKEQHPFTGAAPGGWGWSHCPGSVPDCDDTPGAMLSLFEIQDSNPQSQFDTWSKGRNWIQDIQNKDGGWPTFCKGWGKLPFDRSGCDITAHAIRTLWRIEKFKNRNTEIDRVFLDNKGAKRAIEKGFKYLSQHQNNIGSWHALWFGNQNVMDDENHVYGTSRVLAAYRDVQLIDTNECQRGVKYLLSVQNADGGWGGAKDCPSSVEETALAVEVLIDLAPGEAVHRGVNWLIDAIESDRYKEPSPIGFYFAKLWYFEKLYPLIFTVAALGRVFQNQSRI